MLVSTYVFMRFDKQCPEYRSREDYYRAAARDTILTAGDLYRLMSDTKYILIPSQQVSRFMIWVRFTGIFYVMRIKESLKQTVSSIFRSTSAGEFGIFLSVSI